MRLACAPPVKELSAKRKRKQRGGSLLIIDGIMVKTE
jgi:hypothetical protein